MTAPADWVDGFAEAFWNRPEALLEAEVRASQSMGVAPARAGRAADRRSPLRLVVSER